MTLLRSVFGLLFALAAILAALGAAVFLAMAGFHGFTSFTREWEDAKSGMALFGLAFILVDVAELLMPRLKERKGVQR